jgi:hypothetical protein
MCDYSLETVKTRPARVGDKVVNHRFWSATGGFCAPEDIHLAVCLLPGTEMSFAFEVKRSGLWCPPSALVGQIRQIEEGSVSGSS